MHSPGFCSRCPAVELGWPGIWSNKLNIYEGAKFTRLYQSSISHVLVGISMIPISSCTTECAISSGLRIEYAMHDRCSLATSARKRRQTLRSDFAPTDTVVVNRYQSLITWKAATNELPWRSRLRCTNFIALSDMSLRIDPLISFSCALKVCKQTTLSLPEIQIRN